MDEYAKQQSIEFNQWIRGFENSTKAKDFFDLETDSQLYDKFIQSKENS